SPRLRWLVDYACRDDYGAASAHTSAWAGLFYFASRVARPGAEPQPFVTWPEGNGRIVSHLHAQVQRHVRLGWAPADIIPTDAAGADVTAIEPGGAAIGFHAAQVLFAAPQFLTRWLIRPYRERPPRHVADFEYGSWLVANLTLRARPVSRGFPL